jgi:hypothetical protein
MRNPLSKSLRFVGATEKRGSVDYRSELSVESLAPIADACDGDRCCSPMYMAGRRADVLEIKRPGVVAVVVDPLVY